MPGKGGAVDALAALVQRHEPVFFREEACDGGCLLRHPGGGIAGAAFRNFMNLKAAEAELAADIIEALAIALGKLPFGTLLQSADSDDNEAHPALFPAHPMVRSTKYMRYRRFAPARLTRSPSPSPDSVSTTFPGCRIREPPA